MSLFTIFLIYHKESNIKKDRSRNSLSTGVPAPFVSFHPQKDSSRISKRAYETFFPESKGEIPKFQFEKLLPILSEIKLYYTINHSTNNQNDVKSRTYMAKTTHSTFQQFVPRVETKRFHSHSPIHQFIKRKENKSNFLFIQLR